MPEMTVDRRTTPLWLRLSRVALGLLTIAAIVVQFRFSVGNVAGFSPSNFFSFFTIQSNILAALVLLLGARPFVRGAAVLYMCVTGLVYATLLSGLEEALNTQVP
jgi:hypothetical protein